MPSLSPRFLFDRPLLVIDVVGLRPKDLALAPKLSAFAGRGKTGLIEPALPALTSTVQASILTGLDVSEHGIVGNGWYHRDLAQVLFWQQSDRLVQGKKIYDYGLEALPEFRCAKLFWWFNMYGSPALSLTPRPQYFANGLKLPGLYSKPHELAKQIQEELGPFPLFNFWGPAAGIESTRWISDAAISILEAQRPQLALVYLPHLDYDHQRYGPEHPKSRDAVKAVDHEASRLIDSALVLGMDVLVLSEYGIEEVERPVYLNRRLREEKYLAIQETQHGELLDGGASRAFAVVDHQFAHVYVAREADLLSVKKLLLGMEGVDRVLDRDEQKAISLDHERSGELVCMAERGSWFAYPYWLEESKRPDFANTVDIHRKPGYDPAELFLDPKIAMPRLRIAKRLLAKKFGFRYLMDVIPTDPSQVRGSHGLAPLTPEHGPLYIASPGLNLPDIVPAKRVLFAGS